jgi:hypothetical protein
MSIPQTVVGQFALGRGRHLVATVAHLRGQLRLDLREWVESVDPTVTWLFSSKRGINVSAAQGEDLVHLVYALYSANQTSDGTVPEVNHGHVDASRREDLDGDAA